MVRHEVDDYLHAGRMSPAHQSPEFCHSFFRLDCQIWVDVEIICYGVWGSGVSLDPLGARRGAAAGIAAGSVAQHARIPYMSDSQRLKIIKSRLVNILEAPRSVLLYRP